jgi:hypothetical protein
MKLMETRAMLRRGIERLRAFGEGQTGAVAVDWVVLSAAVVGLGIGAVATVRIGAGGLGDGIGASLGGASVASMGTGAVALASYALRFNWGYDVMAWMEAASSSYTDQDILDSFDYHMSVLAHGYSAQALDAAYVVMSDMQRRGIATSEQIAALNAVIAANAV